MGRVHGKQKAVKAAVLFLCIIAVAFILFTVIRHSGSESGADVYVYSITAADLEEVSAFYSASGTNTLSAKKLQKAIRSGSWVPVKCEFTVQNSGTGTEKFKKAVITSDEYKFVYDRSAYNICESPAEIEPGGTCCYSIYILVQESDLAAVCSGETAFDIRLVL